MEDGVGRKVVDGVGDILRPIPTDAAVDTLKFNEEGEIDRYVGKWVVC